MSIAKEQFDWYFLEEDNGDDESVKAFGQGAGGNKDNEPSDGAASGQDRPIHHLYELLLGIALVYGIEVYFIWQQAEQRMAVLESEITALYLQLTEQPSMDKSEADLPHPIATLDNITLLPTLLETDYLRFEASAQTAELVKSVANLSNTKYAQLRQAFALTSTISTDKLTILVDIDAGSRQNDGTLLLVQSPRVTAERYHITEVDALTSEIFFQLVQYVLEQALQGRAIKPQWQIVVSALQEYLQHENGYDPDWQLHSTYLYRRHMAQLYSIDLILQDSDKVQAQGKTALVQTPTALEIAEPLIEYLMETYGYACVPMLLDAFEDEQAWATVIPAVFPVSLASFEEDWHLYLKQHYPIKDPYSLRQE